jgi:hypothetical protein
VLGFFLGLFTLERLFFFWGFSLSRGCFFLGAFHSREVGFFLGLFTLERLRSV